MSLLLGWPDLPESTSQIGFVRSATPCPAKRPVADPSAEGHWLCVAPTGAGKSASFAIPQLLSYPGSVIAVDVKGELVATTSRWRAALGEVLVLDPFDLFPGRGGGFDPLGHLDPADPSLVDDAYTLAALFSSLPAGGRNKDPFWDEWGQDLIAAFIVHAVRSPDPSKRSLAEVYRRISADDPIYSTAVMLDSETVHPFTKAKLGAWLSLPEVTRGGVTATVCQQVRMLAGPGVQRSFARDSIDMQALAEGAPSTVYIVLPPDRLASHSALVRIVLTSLVQRMLRRRHRPETPTLFMVDEAAQLGPIPALMSAITLGRGFGLRAALLVQSLAQLRTAYDTQFETLLENCSLLTMGPHTAFSMARQLAEQGFGDVSADTLFRLGRDGVMIRANGEPSRRLRKLDYRRDEMFKGRFDANPLYQPARVPRRDVGPQLELPWTGGAATA